MLMPRSISYAVLEWEGYREGIVHLPEMNWDSYSTVAAAGVLEQDYFCLPGQDCKDIRILERI